MYLLKNIKYHKRLYSDILDKKTGAVVRICDFLLRLRNRLAHESYLAISESDDQVHVRGLYVSIAIAVVRAVQLLRSSVQKSATSCKGRS